MGLWSSYGCFRYARTKNGSAGGVAHAVLVGELVELLLEVGVEGEADRGQAGVELVGAAGADDGRRDRRVGQDPGDRHRDQADPGLLGELPELVHRVELGVVP